MQKLAGMAVLVLVFFPSARLSAQNVIKDYICNAPRQFTPSDPWTTGRVFRTQMGHGGIFYNCDGQEDKRFSPYIDWRCQNLACSEWFPLRDDICQQIDEVKQRIRWGKGCDVPRYVVPWTPAERFGRIVPASGAVSENEVQNVVPLVPAQPQETLARRWHNAKESSGSESSKGLLR
jgi:hypothetical protein